MKCLKNKKTGNIIRVDDQQANQIAGISWKYISKSEWKVGVTKEAPTEQQSIEAKKKEETVSKKVARRSKFKSHD